MARRQARAPRNPVLLTSGRGPPVRACVHSVQSLLKKAHPLCYGHLSGVCGIMGVHQRAVLLFLGIKEVAFCCDPNLPGFLPKSRSGLFLLSDFIKKASIYQNYITLLSLYKFSTPILSGGGRKKRPLIGEKNGYFIFYCLEAQRKFYPVHFIWQSRDPYFLASLGRIALSQSGGLFI